MIDRLPVRADQADARGTHAKFAAGVEHGLREKLPQAEIELADFAGRGLRRLADAQHRGANLGGQRKGRKVFQARSRTALAGGAGGDTHQRDVNAVRRRAAHQSDDKTRSASRHEICFFIFASRLRASIGRRLSRSAERSASMISWSSGVNSACCLATPLPEPGGGARASLNWCSL